MARKIFKRWLPDPATFKKHPALNFMSHLLQDPNLFHLNRHSVSGAFFIGLFVAFLPTPGQMPIAALLGFACRVNVPLSVALVWFSNPVTMPPLFYAAYELGGWVLSTPPTAISLQFSWEWFLEEFPNFWQPLLVGCLLLGVVCGGIGYITMQLFWRWQVVRNWEKRKQRNQRTADARREAQRQQEAETGDR